MCISHWVWCVELYWIVYRLTFKYYCTCLVHICGTWNTPYMFCPAPQCLYIWMYESESQFFLLKHSKHFNRILLLHVMSLHENTSFCLCKSQWCHVKCTVVHLCTMASFTVINDKGYMTVVSYTAALGLFSCMKYTVPIALST